MSVAIELSGVTKWYGPTRALNALTLQVHGGEMFGLIGSDGAGKTTAIRLMCGLLRADSGKVGVLGHDPVREHRRVTERVGYLVAALQPLPGISRSMRTSRSSPRSMACGGTSGVATSFST